MASTTITYTEDDKAAAYEFSKANYYIRLIQEMSKIRPNIISWLDIDIRDATQADYFIPEQLIGRAKVVSVKMTKKACEMTTCTPMRETVECRKTDSASYYRTSESTFDVQCQPACFNTASKPTYDTTNTQVPDTPQLRWHNNACRIVNHSVEAWETKPRYRGDTQYEKRLNDLPIGFRQIPSDNPFGSGVTYKNDRAYCSFYELEYDEAKDTCVTSLIDKIVGAVVGSSLLQNLKGGIRAAVNGGNALELPDYVKPLPTTHLPTVDEWRNDVNKAFVVPETIDYTKTPTRRKRSLQKSYEHPRILLDRMERARAVYSENTMKVLNIQDNNGHDDDDVEDNSHGRRVKRDATSVDGAANGDDDDKNNTAPELTTGEKIWEGIFDYFTNEENRLSVLYDLAPLAKAALKKLITKLAEKLGPKLAKILTKVSGKIGFRVIQTALQNVAAKVVASSLFRIASQITLFLGRMLAAAASIVGWLLFAAFIFDLMFTFWDPFGYNNLFPPKMPGDTMYNGELSLRQAFSQATADYEWEQFVRLLLSEDTVFLIGLESMTDQILYLDLLTVNSEGSVIDKGEQVSFQGVDPAKLEESNNAERAKQYHFNSEKFQIYNSYYYRRARVNGFLQKLGYIVVGLGGFLLLTQFKMIAFLCLLFAITILCFGSLFSLENDQVIDLVYNSPIKFIDDQ